MKGIFLLPLKIAHNEVIIVYSETYQDGPDILVRHQGSGLGGEQSLRCGSEACNIQ